MSTQVDDLIDDAGWDPATVVIVLVAAAVVLLAAAIVFLVLWRRKRTALAWHDYDKAVAEHANTSSSLTLSDQRARLTVIRELDEVVILQLRQAVQQAEGAVLAAERDPELAVRALQQFTETAQTVIGDMRRVVSIAMEGESAADEKPQFASLAELFRTMADEGLAITVRETGEQYRLRPGAEVSVYNVIKDALDNTLKHGGKGAEVGVDMEWTPDGFRVRIEDNGTRNQAILSGADPDVVQRTTEAIVSEEIAAFVHHVSGPSLSRMRERVEAFGGILQAKEVPGVGFSISATYPSLRWHNGVHGVNVSR